MRKEQLKLEGKESAKALKKERLESMIREIKKERNSLPASPYSSTRSLSPSTQPTPRPVSLGDQAMSGRFIGRDVEGELHESTDALQPSRRPPAPSSSYPTASEQRLPPPRLHSVKAARKGADDGDCGRREEDEEGSSRNVLTKPPEHAQGGAVVAVAREEQAKASLRAHLNRDPQVSEGSGSEAHSVASNPPAYPPPMPGIAPSAYASFSGSQYASGGGHNNHIGTDGSGAGQRKLGAGAAQATSRSITGIGITFRGVDGMWCVAGIKPAFRELLGGVLAPGDTILHIDGTACEGLAEKEVASLIVGPAGSKCTLNISRSRPGGARDQAGDVSEVQVQRLVLP